MKNNITVVLFVYLLFISNYLNATQYVTNTNDSGAGSLRQAIINANPTGDIVSFTIPTSNYSPITITLFSPLPAYNLNSFFEFYNGYVVYTPLYNRYTNKIILSAIPGVASPGMVFTGSARPSVPTGTFVGFSTSTIYVTNTADNGTGSLRDAIWHANLCPTSKENIYFNIPGTAPHKINVSSPFSSIDSPILIDGSTQPGNGYIGNNPKIELNGTPLDYMIGLLCTVSSEIYGLYIHNFGYGIQVKGSGHTIGALNKGNVVSGNKVAIALGDITGINVSSGANNVIIQNNLIGTDPSGTFAEPNIGKSSSNSAEVLNLGGTNIKVLNNLISGNQYYAIGNSGESSMSWKGGKAINNLEIKGNKIGTDITGQYAIPNNEIIYFYHSVSNITIGGPALSDRNLISGNSSLYSSIYLGNTLNYKIENNYIGTDITGTLPIPNVNFFINSAEEYSYATIPSGTIQNNLIAFNGNTSIGGKYTVITKNTIYNNLGTVSKNPGLASPVVTFRCVDSIVGTASPNIKIELYEDNGFNVFTQGKSYVGETTADATGNWKYVGVIANPCFVTAIAINLTTNNSSAFSLGGIYNIGANKTACANTDTITLDAGSGFSSYLWSTGEITQKIKVTQTADYFVEVNNGCMYRDTQSVDFLPKPILYLGNDTTICQGQSLILNAETLSATYKWNNTFSYTAKTITVSTAGIYFVDVTIGSCTTRDSIKVFSKAIPVVNLGHDTLVCNGSTFILNAKNPGCNYLWSTGALTQTISVSTTGSYIVEVFHEGACHRKDTINVTFVACDFISGKVFEDVNQNCIQNVGEKNYNGKLIQLKNTGNNVKYYATVDSSGNYKANLPLGNYDVSYILRAFQQTVCPVSNKYSVTMNGSITVPPCNFAIYTPVINDFSIGLTNVSMVRIRSIAKYSITYTNFGNDDSTGQIKFVKDPFVNFGTQTISNQIIGDTLLYQFAPLASGQSRTFAIYIDIPNNQTLIGKSLCVNAFINTNKLDLNRSNNSVQSCAVVNYPLDPNYKTVFPSGTTPNGFISAADSILTYTINFQNTGTDTAYNVIITDSISPLLNVGSIEVIASSHPQNLTISGQGLATFTFNSIMLPDSNINEEGSHGFVQYTIRLNKGLPIGSVINNFASIYFDLNAPVVTNQTVSTLSSLVNQTMNFPSIQDVPFDHLPIHLNANATSGLAINTIVSGPVTLAGDSLLINGEGQVRVRTYQQGDGIYTAAKYIDRVFKIHPAPVASISSPSSSAICASKPVNFSVLLAKGTPPFSFKLSNGTDVFDFTNQPLNSIVSVTPTTSGAFQLLNVVDSTQAGPQGPFGSEQVTVNSLPTLVITQPSPVCNTSTVDITASSITSGSNPGLTYSYWRNATATIVEPNANSINSTSTVYIKGVNASGCSEIKQVSVTINPTPSLLISNPAAVCSPATVDITATAVTTGSSSGLTYSYWQDPAATIVKSSVSTLNNSGIVYIKGSNGLGCFSIKPVNVTIYQLPSATLSNPTFDSIEVGEATEFTVTLYSGTNPFSCTLSNGTDIFTFTGQTSPALLSVNPTVSGVFQVVNLTDNNACAMLGSFGAQTVTLKPITSTIDGLGKEEIFEIYPNPSQGNFEIRIVQKNADLANGEISIYNSTGILIDTRKIEYQNFYTTNLGKGIYFVSIGNSGKRVTKKLVID